ncbi:MAG: TIGR03905 family TSCPD domain-containing protein [Clostridia bacterium]|nr:TIGR03905 family TSCPD domain-containing protein [Clostridia bacterium]
MKQYQYKTRGTCSSAIRFSLEDGRLRDVAFTGGCNGNLKAIARLVEGMPADKVVALLRGNTCGAKATSCADQLAAAVELAMQES